MSLDINNLKDSIENLSQTDAVYVDLQIFGTEDIIRCGIKRISQPRTGLELIVQRDRTSQVTISEFKDL